MIIYKKDSNNKIRSLEIKVDNGNLIQISGLIDGKKVTNTKLCKSKNVGRSNETSPIEQSSLEADALLIKKLKEGYFVTKEGALNNEVILPMLAKEYGKEKHKVIFPCYVQPKLDGMRAISNSEGITSRKNRSIVTMSHIASKIDFKTVIDGELYADGLSFQENMKLIKKYRPMQSELIKYHVYDLISDKPFIERYNDLKELIKDIPVIKLVPTYEIHNEDELKEYHRQFLSQGYEGTIIRWGNEPYKLNGRSSNLLKYKDFLDITSKVLDVIPSDARPEQGVILCDGFKASLKFSHAERAEILLNKDKYIGEMAEIRFFEYTDEGKPRFPVCVGFRLDK